MLKGFTLAARRLGEGSERIAGRAGELPESRFLMVISPHARVGAAARLGALLIGAGCGLFSVGT